MPLRIAPMSTPPSPAQVVIGMRRNLTQKPSYPSVEAEVMQVSSFCPGLHVAAVLHEEAYFH